MTGNTVHRVLLALLMIFSIITCGVKAIAYDITVTTEVSPLSVTTDDIVFVTVTISGPDTGKTGTPEIDDAPEFIQLGRPSFSSSTQIVNFNVSSTKSYTYRFQPGKEGTFKLGGATIVINGEKFRAKSQQVTVTKGSQPPSQSQSNNKNQRNQQEHGGDPSGNRDIFVRAFVDNDTPYFGQQITHTFELYNRMRFFGDTEYESPSTTGFWEVKLPQIQPSQKSVNGTFYNHNAIKTALFATTSGELEIGGTRLKYSEGGFLAPVRSRILSTKPILIKVRPLPEKGKPSDFSGAVGDYTLTAVCDKTTVSVGDVVTIKVNVTGTGNIDLVTELVSPDFSEYKTYDPRVGETLINSGLTIGGAKSWEYVVSPRETGEANIGSFKLSFFNPEDEQYHTVETNPFRLTVTPGTTASSASSSNGTSQTRVTNLASDIRFIKSDKTNLVSVQRSIHKNISYYLFYLLPLALFSIAYFIKRRRDTLEQNTGLKRRLSAWKRAEKLVQEASSLVDSGKTGEFTGKLSDAVTGFIGDRLNIEPAALTSSDVESILTGNGLSHDLSVRVRKMLEFNDFVRFSSDYSGDNIQQKLLTDTRDLLQSLKERL